MALFISGLDAAVQGNDTDPDGDPLTTSGAEKSTG